MNEISRQNQEQRTEKRIQAYELRLEGLRYDEIDEFLSLKPGTASHWCAAIRKASVRDDGKALLDMELDRLDKLRARASADVNVLEDHMKQESVTIGFINPKTVEAHGKALLVLLRIDESYRKLTGADAAEKVDVVAEVKSTTPQEEKVMEMIRRVNRENHEEMKRMSNDG